MTIEELIEQTAKLWVDNGYCADEFDRYFEIIEATIRVPDYSNVGPMVEALDKNI